MARKTVPWDAADTLESGEDIAAYLDAVLEDGDLDLLKAAIGDIARAKGMTDIAQETGLGRAGLYKALSPEGNPEFVTVTKVLKALGLRLSVSAMHEALPNAETIAALEESERGGGKTFASVEALMADLHADD